MVASKDVKIYNDYRRTPIDGGYMYVMEEIGGSAKIRNYIFDSGFLLNHIDDSARVLVNQDRVGKMDYLLINAGLYGRVNIEVDSESHSRIAGTG